MLHVVFRLYGPFASWGEVALGTHRPTSATPTRSALLGLCGAAHGLDRADTEGLARLASSLRFATETRAAGELLEDYHTAQTRHSRAKRPFATRKEELDVDPEDIETILTTRDYRTNPSYVVAAWNAHAERTPLEQLRARLDEPIYAPYLGRRACVLAHPLEPRLVETATLADAFSQVAWDARLDGPRGATWVLSDAHPHPGTTPHDELTRWDNPTSSGLARRFASRAEQRSRRSVPP